MNRSLLSHELLAASILLAGGIAGWFVWSRPGERNGVRAGIRVDTNTSSIRSHVAGTKPVSKPSGFQKSDTAAPADLWSGPPSPLVAMTETTWRQVVASYGENEPAPGSERATEWRLALARAGELAGEGAVNALLEADRKDGRGFTRAAEAFAGWAGRDPDAAWEWLAASNDEKLRSALLPHFALRQSGDPAVEALTALPRLHSDDQDATADRVVLDLIQSAGYEAGDALLEELIKDESGDSETDPMVRSLFEVLAQYREEAVRNGGSLEAQREWLETFADRSFVSSEHFKVAASQLQAQQGPAAAVDWLAALAGTGTAAPAEPALQDLLRHWAEQDADAAGRWLAAQREHPAYDALAAHLRASRSSRAGK
jgi:hypothetical protein